MDGSCFLQGRVRGSTGVFHERFRAMVCGASGASVCLVACASAAAALPAGASKVCFGLIGAGRKHCDCRAACADVPSVNGGRRGLSTPGGCTLRCARFRPYGWILAAKSPRFLSWRIEYVCDMLIVLSCLLGRISVGNDEVGGTRWPAYRSSARSKRKHFLVMRFEKANGCATPEGIDAALKMHWPRYAKRMPSTQFSAKQIRGANERVKAKSRKL